MAALAKQLAKQAGTALTFTAAAVGGDTVPCESGTALIVKNGSGSSVTVTVVTPGTKSGLAIADQTVAVAAGAETIIGPFGSDFADTTDGRAHVSYSSVTTVTVACVHIA